MFIETKGLRIFIYQELIDMRSGFEKLLHIVRDQMKGSINQGHLFVFLGKNRRRIKSIYYDGTGLVLTAKKIERGQFMQRSELRDITELSVYEFKQIWSGGVVVKARPERSFVTQVGPALLPKGFESELSHAQL